ncbi:MULTISPECIES: carbohydrate kinase family protein [Saccharothrix]|uniref:carbohydrate kinase family protein n=1 Tax=Saccharothrix TaxID=2071 RepID=UPI0009389F9A|nr:carbohydrate kinase family protein [Saccharothrix sp. CB00851]OKI32043.1 ribokinase [Saccharothrix sp. CB00851]
MTYPGRFGEHFLVDQIDQVSLSFLVDRLDVHPGGVAANICFGMGQLGLAPVLVGAVGRDFDGYRARLEQAGVDTGFVHVSQELHTSRFLCTTDQDENQIASFYAGAMSEARDIALAPIVSAIGGVDLVVVAPNDPGAMLRHSAECRARAYPFAADPSQQLARLTGEEVRDVVEGAKFLLTNEYEHALLLDKTKWSRDEVLGKVGAWVTTLGDSGARIEIDGEPTVHVPAVRARSVLDPTGVGDGFRAGFLGGLSWGLDLEGSAQLGCAFATLVLENVGSQEYEFDVVELLRRMSETYGPPAAARVREHLVGSEGRTPPAHVG